jgi:folate-dependent phosphoribosylglycinamide formyltransferase PurN
MKGPEATEPPNLIPPCVEDVKGLDPDETRGPGPACRLRLLIVTNGNFFAWVIIRGLLRSIRPAEAGILEIAGDYGGRTGVRSLLWVARRTALPYLLFKVAVIGATGLGKVMGGRSQGQVGLPTPPRRSSAARIAEEGAMRFVEVFRPDVIVSVSCPQKIPDKLLSMARLCSVNIHSSLLPRYAGLAPYFWVLVNKEAQTGTTVHYMTSKFDEGRILCQRTILIEDNCSAFSLFLKLAREGGPTLGEAVTLAAQGYKGLEQCPAERSYFSHPDWRSYLRLRRNGFRLVRIRELIALTRGSLDAR